MVIKQQLTVLLSLFCSSHHTEAHNQSLLKDTDEKTDKIGPQTTNSPYLYAGNTVWFLDITLI